MMLFRWLPLGLVFLALSGCAISKLRTASTTRPFQFERDTFAFANELVWEYTIDPVTGKTTAHRREPKPEYTLHCFVVARSVRQFFDHARFDPALPKGNQASYRQLVRQVVGRNPRKISNESERVVIPGYADLREFSAAHESLIKEECGGAWQSYFQRGHWRMIFPFSRQHQRHTAEELKIALTQSRLPLVHLVCFPKLTINHAMLVFDCSDAASEIRFTIYDPNDPDTPSVLRFDRNAQTFFLPRNKYFAGGEVDVYEIYHAMNY
jgi:hypothetical protein